MEKNIKIISIIIAILYFGVVINDIYNGLQAAVAGFEMGWDDSENETYSELYHIKVQPSNGLLTFPETLTNALTGEVMDAEAGEYRIRAAMPEKMQTGIYFAFNLLKMISSFILLAVFIYIPILFFKIIRAVTRNEILKEKTIKKVSRMGWLLLGVYVYGFLVYNIGDVILARQIIQIEGYSIVPNLSNFTSLFLSLVILLLAGILKHTARIKEEQDLTI